MRGLVVAPEPPAAEAGAWALRQGGNAADAAVAAAFAQCVTDPLMCGIGGTAVGLARRGPDGPVRVVDAAVVTGSVPVPQEWQTGYVGRAETIGRYIVRGEGNQLGYASVMVPGFVRGAQHLYANFGSGRLAWRTLLEPAIGLAADGFEVFPYIAAFWADTEDRPGYPSLTRKMACTPDGGRIFLKPGGRPYAAGDRLVQHDLARTLKRLAAEGPDEFYEGETGRRIAEDFAAHGGMFTPDDLRDYRVLEYDPLQGRYRGHRVVSVPPPASGAQLIEMLQVAEAMGLASVEHNSPAYIDLMARLMTATFFEHASLKLDPPYTMALGVIAQSLDPRHARRLAAVLRDRRPAGPVPVVSAPGTTHVSVADEEGTLVSFTHSIGSLGGAGVVTPGLGILFNNFVGHFSPLPGLPDSIAKGKRGGGGCPTLLFRDGAPLMVIGAPGGSRLITAVFQSILNVLDRGMTMADAVSAPRFHAEEPGLVFLEPAFAEPVADAVRALGYDVRRTTYMSRVQAILMDGDGFSAGPDPRGGAGAVLVDD
ncbi:MAG: gamma-glutamyltransferase [Armatimonadota bacterium]|nr:gamma-glutamyltransferase [Armatimonadota bacterium]